MKTQNDILRVEEVATLFQVKEATVREWIKEKRIPAKKIGKRWFVSSEVVKQFMVSDGVCPYCHSELGVELENTGFTEPEGPSHMEVVGQTCPNCGHIK